MLTKKIKSWKVLLCLLLFLFPVTGFGQTILFTEDFENTNLSARGWYDNTAMQFSTIERIPGSTRSLEFRWIPGGSQPTSGGAIRKLFTETDSVYVSYWIKYSTNYTGSNQEFGPHEFYFLTNLSSAFNNLAFTRLTAYIEHNKGVPILRIQDGENIDQTKIGVNLVNVTENRSVAGCNGNSDGYDIRGPFGDGDCYLNGSVRWNGKQWKANEVYFSNSPGPRYKSDWHFVEVFFKLNTVSNGKILADGEMKYWFDGSQIMNFTGIVFRTGRHPNMKFNQFVMGPYMGSSPVDQRFWIDDLTVATGRVVNDARPAPPQNLRVE